MRDNDLFRLALGITSPWCVASSGFDAEKKRLDIALGFKACSQKKFAVALGERLGRVVSRMVARTIIGKLAPESPGKPK